MKPEILVKLKMKSSYKIVLTFIFLLIIGSLAIGYIYIKYDTLFDKDEDIVVNGSISINYLSGKKFEINGESNVKFTVTNTSDKPSYYSVFFTNIRGNGKYILLKEDEEITSGNIKSIDEEKIIDISIDGNKTENYTIEIDSEEEITGSINIRVQDVKKETFADLILKNNAVSSPLTNVGTEISVENEGLIKSSDDLGVSYYFRGNIQNNYVVFDNLTWRIIRINGDGTVRLILDRLTSTVSNYYNDENNNYEFENSEMGKFLESWYQDNIKSQELVANTKYCNDISYDDEYIYNSYTRIMVNYIPTLNCLGNVLSSHIGLPTIDEVIMAGANSSLNNDKFYLYNKDITNTWYTMSGAKGNSESFNPFMVNDNGSIQTGTTGNLYRGVRPVINLVKNIEMQGTGTIDNPYVVVENE